MHSYVAGLVFCGVKWEGEEQDFEDINWHKMGMVYFSAQQ